MSELRALLAEAYRELDPHNDDDFYTRAADAAAKLVDRVLDELKDERDELRTYLEDLRRQGVVLPGVCADLVVTAVMGAINTGGSVRRAVYELLECYANPPDGSVWRNCTPDLLASGVDCAKAPRLPGDGLSHQHLVAEPIAPATPYVADSLDRAQKAFEASVNPGTPEATRKDAVWSYLHHVTAAVLCEALQQHAPSQAAEAVEWLGCALEDDTAAQWVHEARTAIANGERITLPWAAS